MSTLPNIWGRPTFKQQRVYATMGHGADEVHQEKKVVPSGCGYVTFVECGRTNLLVSTVKLLCLMREPIMAGHLLSYPDYPPFNRLLSDIFDISPDDHDSITVRRPYMYYTDNYNSLSLAVDDSPQIKTTTKSVRFIKSGVFELQQNGIIPPISSEFVDPVYKITPSYAEYLDNSTRPLRLDAYDLTKGANPNDPSGIAARSSIMYGSMLFPRSLHLQQDGVNEVRVSELLGYMTQRLHEYQPGLLYNFACRYADQVVCRPQITLQRSKSHIQRATVEGSTYNSLHRNTNSIINSNIATKTCLLRSMPHKFVPIIYWLPATKRKVLHEISNFVQSDLDAFIKQQNCQINFRRAIVTTLYHILGREPHYDEFMTIATLTPQELSAYGEFNASLLEPSYAVQRYQNNIFKNKAYIEDFITRCHTWARGQQRVQRDSNLMYEDEYHVEIPNNVPSGRPIRCVVSLNADIEKDTWWSCNGHHPPLRSCPFNGTNTTFAIRFTCMIGAVQIDLCSACAKFYSIPMNRESVRPNAVNRVSIISTPVNRANIPIYLGRTEIRVVYCSRRLGVEAIPGSDGQCGPDDGPQCADCRNTPLVNRVNIPIHFGANGTLYCSRRLGVEAIPGSDGQCGPDDGPQCLDCQFTSFKLIRSPNEIAVNNIVHFMDQPYMNSHVGVQLPL